MVMFIKYLSDTKQAKAGDVKKVIDGGEASAKALIDAGIAEETTDPTSDPGIDKATQEMIDAVVRKHLEKLTNATEKGFGALANRIKAQTDAYELGTEKALKLPATARRFSTVRNFKDDGINRKEAKAYYMGCFAMALKGKPWARKRLADAGMVLRPYDEGDSDIHAAGVSSMDELATQKAAAENVNFDSGYLVPEEIGSDIVDLREQYGVFRQYAKIVPMTSDTRTDPRRKDGVAVSFVGEGSAGTQADKTWNQVRLTAKKLMALTKYSTEISEDAMINIGDDLAEEFAYAFALKEDQCGFNGDATSTYGGIRGVTTRLKGVSATIANIAGLTVATGTGYGSSYGATVLGDFNKVVGTLPEYAEQRDPRCAWFVSKFYWGSVMQKLATAAGGNKVSDIVNGARMKEFLGYPVVISQVMPKTPAVNQVVALLGSMRLSTNFGTRREIGISVSNSALNAFEQDQLVMRGTERFDINVHDVGDDTSTAGDSAQAGPVAGPIVGLITASS